MKKKVIFALAIIIIIIVAFMLKNKLNNKYNYEIVKVSEYNYFITRENEKFGVIDKNGKVVIEAKYSKVVIPNPEKDLFICYEDDKTKIMNSNNQELFQEYESVEPIKLKNVASALSFEKNTLIYKKDGLYGLIDFNGKQLTKNIYNLIENLQPTEGKFLVLKDGKKGAIDLKGNVLVKPEYDTIISDGYYTEKDGYTKSGFITSEKREDGYKYGYIDYKGKSILANKYNEINRITKEDDKNIYLIVSENGQFGLYNKTNKIINHSYQEITYEDDIDLLIVKKNKKYGVTNLKGKTIIEVEYDELESRGIYIYAKNSNQNKVYDTQGNVIQINYNKKIYTTANDEYKITTLLNNNITYYGIIDKNGNQVVPEDYRYIEYLYQNYFIATDENGKFGVINSNNKTVLDMKYSSMQKIKGKNIIQAINAETKETEYYSENMKKVITMKNANVQNQNDYVIISNKEEKVYLDNNGNIIENTSNLKNTAFPDTIGVYHKEQITIENIYYVKE